MKYNWRKSWTQFRDIVLFASFIGVLLLSFGWLFEHPRVFLTLLIIAFILIIIGAGVEDKE